MSKSIFGGAPPSVAAATALVARRRPGDFRWRYEDGLVLLALAECGRRRDRPELLAYVEEALRGLLLPGGGIRGYRLEDWNLDQVKPGLLLLDFASRLGPGQAEAGLALLRAQLAGQPRSPSGAFWHKGIYPDQLWLDGLYMAAPFHLRTSLEAGSQAGVEDVLSQFRLALEHCSEPGQPGLLKHAWNEGSAQAWADPQTGRSPNFWARAMGWFLMAQADCLGLLPPGHAGRTGLEAAFRQVAAGVLSVADPETGLWWQVLDQAGVPGNYLEASASAMFVYALMKGHGLGLLGPSRGVDPLGAARKAWASIQARFVRPGEDGLLSLGGICQVAGLGGQPYRDGSLAYYLSEPVVRDDFKGTGPYILAALGIEDAQGQGGTVTRQ